MASAVTRRLFGWDDNDVEGVLSLSSTSSANDATPTTGALLLSLASAIGAPVVFAFVNLVDKVAVDRRVRCTRAYTAVIGLFEMAIGAAECALARWDNVARAGLGTLAWPAVAGVVDGVSVHLYFALIGGTDSSIVVGVQYMYPAVVCVLAYLVLGERLAPPGYAGVALLLAGAALLSTNGLAHALHRVRPTHPLLSGLPELAPRTEKDSDDGDDENNQSGGASRGDDHESPLECWCPGGRGIPCMCGGIETLNGGRQRIPDSADDDDEISLEEEGRTSRESREGNHEDEKEEDENNKDENDESEKEDDEENEGAILGAEEEDEDGVPMRPLGTTTKDEEGVSSAIDEQENNSSSRSKCNLPSGVVFGLMAVPMVLTVGGYEFLIALAAKRGLRTLQVSGIEIAVQGATLALGAVLTRGGRRGFVREAARNWPFALGNSALTIASQLLTVFSLHALPAAVASSLCALQPLGILVLETVARVTAFRVDQCFAFKLPPIVLIVAGVALLSLDVLVHPATILHSASSFFSSSL